MLKQAAYLVHHADNKALLPDQLYKQLIKHLCYLMVYNTRQPQITIDKKTTDVIGYRCVCANMPLNQYCQ